MGPLAYRKSSYVKKSFEPVFWISNSLVFRQLYINYLNIYQALIWDLNAFLHSSDGSVLLY